MSVIECIAAGLMMMGLVLGAMTGAIAILLIPVGAGTLIFILISWSKRQKKYTKTIHYFNYPPYRY